MTVAYLKTCTLAFEQSADDATSRVRVRFTIADTDMQQYGAVMALPNVIGARTATNQDLVGCLAADFSTRVAAVTQLVERGRATI